MRNAVNRNGQSVWSLLLMAGMAAGLSLTGCRGDPDVHVHEDDDDVDAVYVDDDDRDVVHIDRD